MDRDKNLRRLGVLLLLAAAALLVVSPRYEALQSVGTMDNRTLDSAGYETRRGGGFLDDPVVVNKGDAMLGAIMTSQQGAAHYKAVSDRRGLVLLLAVPGAFLLGLTRRREPQGERDRQAASGAV